MGILSRFTKAKPESSILAQYQPQIMSERWNAITATVITLPRNQAMQVPTVARCRNLIAGTIASVPLGLYRKSTGEKLGSPLWIEQPSLHQPIGVTLSWTVDSLLMYGTAIWRITERYADDGRPSRFEWVANTRVTQDYDINGIYITQYYIDGTPVSMNDIVTFQAFDEGILSRGSTTIKAALDIEKAASIAAATPMPTGFITNKGADLTPAEVEAIKMAWDRNRKNGSTAFVTNTLEYTVAQFSPKDMSYQEAKQYFATEVARLCNVPAIYVSADMNSSYTYTNVLDSRKDFVAYSLQPYLDAIAGRLSMDDITAHGNEVKFALAETFLKQDPLAELTVIEKLLALNLITPEQAMNMTDLTPNGEGTVL